MAATQEGELDIHTRLDAVKAERDSLEKEVSGLLEVGVIFVITPLLSHRRRILRHNFCAGSGSKGLERLPTLAAAPIGWARQSLASRDFVAPLSWPCA